jgi:chorismate synthase
MSNSFGKIYKLTSFGESHGPAIGGIIDGIPANYPLDLTKIQMELNRRKPGQSKITTQRQEPDQVIFLSGLMENKTTGAPIAFMINNTDQRSRDYSHIKEKFRPSHADFTYYKKYGIRDYRGGGRSSARTTASIVVAGAIAKQFLPEISFKAYVNRVGKIKLDKKYNDLNLDKIEENIIRCPDQEVAQMMQEEIEKTKKDGDTVGGEITCVIKNVAIGLGQPLFDKLQARLAYAMLNLPAVKGFEYGSGFAGAKMKGSEHNDLFNTDGSTQTNYSGGIQGGISNGMDIYFKVAFKPVATIMHEQETIDINHNKTRIEGKGRHDPCVVPRAVPIVENFAAMVLFDMLLLQKTTKL